MLMKTHAPIPRDFIVRPLRRGQKAVDPVTCGHCHLSWDDAKSTRYTPAPGGRCPFEEFHEGYAHGSDAQRALDSFDPPRRVEILATSGAGYFKKGQFGYALSWDKRGGNYPMDTHGPSEPGEMTYLVSKTKDMRGGALWFTSRGVRFTGRR